MLHRLYRKFNVGCHDAILNRKSFITVAGFRHSEVLDSCDRDEINFSLLYSVRIANLHREDDTRLKLFLKLN